MHLIHVPKICSTAPGPLNEVFSDEKAGVYYCRNEKTDKPIAMRLY